MYHYPQALIVELEERARQLRLDSVEMIHRRGSGHPGGALSAAEIMAALFFHKLRLDPKRPDWPERDRFILSKGHASAILYAALARRGFFPQEDLQAWGKLECHLQGHPDRLKTPGVEMTTGILGHGVAIGAGLALVARLNAMDYRVYVLLGDGECQGGIVWEGAMAAAKYRLSNLTAMVDYNDVQLDGPVHQIMPLEPLADKWRACNWQVLEINGHNLRQVLEALDMAGETHHRPTVILAHTTKGKGVSYMENQAEWHGIAPSDEQLRQAVTELTEEVA
ncbi:MAG: transketolase [Anaerolineales bacterium]|nr:MAG: transketolase [Anaerolineales bacterium]